MDNNTLYLLETLAVTVPLSGVIGYIVYNLEMKVRRARTMIARRDHYITSLEAQRDEARAMADGRFVAGVENMERELKRLQALNEKAAANVGEAHRKAKEARVSAASTSRPDINSQEFSTQLAKSIPLHLALDYVHATDFVNDDQIHMVEVSFRGIVLDEASKHHNKVWSGSFEITGALVRDPAIDLHGIVRNQIVTFWDHLLGEGQ